MIQLLGGCPIRAWHARCADHCLAKAGGDLGSGVGLIQTIGVPVFASRMEGMGLFALPYGRAFASVGPYAFATFQKMAHQRGSGAGRAEDEDRLGDQGFTHRRPSPRNPFRDTRLSGTLAWAPAPGVAITRKAVGLQGPDFPSECRRQIGAEQHAVKLLQKDLVGHDQYRIRLEAAQEADELLRSIINLIECLTAGRIQRVLDVTDPQVVNSAAVLRNLMTVQSLQFAV